MVSATPSAGAQRQLDVIARSQPESGPWLALLAAAIREAGEPAWDEAAAGTSLRAHQAELAPLLTGATVPISRSLADDWPRRLLALAGEASPAVAPLAAAAAARPDGIALLEGAINQDAPRLGAQAAALGVDPDALAAVAQLAAMPLLHACRRLVAAMVATDWAEGSCPVCGAWPALAESRGLERARRPRCARCGGDWSLPAFRCPFCRNDDHQLLGTLVSESGGEARKVDTCDRCRGYVKSVATLRAWAADEVALADLATVDLDLAAIERDYARPVAPAVDLGVRLVAPSSLPPVPR